MVSCAELIDVSSCSTAVLEGLLEGVPSIAAAATERGVCRISLSSRPRSSARWRRDLGLDASWREGGVGIEILEQLFEELREYARGERRRFGVPLDFEGQGTAFQRAVWQALRSIPFGRVISYGELATRVERPGAARAVGQANGRNPLPILVPCHRVVAAGGQLGGFTGGLDIKRALLRLEGVEGLR